MKSNITDLSLRYVFALLLFILQFRSISKLLMITNMSADFIHLICQMFLLLSLDLHVDNNLTAPAFLFGTNFTPELLSKVYMLQMNLYLSEFVYLCSLTMTQSRRRKMPTMFQKLWLVHQSPPVTLCPSWRKRSRLTMMK